MKPRHKISYAVISLRISAVIYALLGVAMFPLLLLTAEENSFALPVAIALLLFALALAAGCEFVVWGLKRRKFWAWIAGLCIFGLFVPSLFLPLGVIGLIGLLDGASQKEFGVGGREQEELPMETNA